MRSLSFVLAAHTLSLLLILPPGENRDAGDQDDEHEFKCVSMSMSL